jgi:hypothetical protein
MSIVIVPQHDVAGEPHPVGKLASTLLSVAVAGSADPARFRRGKTYVLDDAVLRLEVSAGMLKASVVGSRATPYEVAVAVQTIARPETLTNSGGVLREHIATLAPQSDELLATCTCPDFDDPCKHAVAALLALSSALVGRPELLVEWRCGDAPATPRATVGSRASSERHLRLVSSGGVATDGSGSSDTRSSRELGSVRGRATPPPSPFDSDEWREFEGLDLPHPVMPEIARTSAPVGTALVDRVDVGAIVRSAIEALRQFMR